MAESKIVKEVRFALTRESVDFIEVSDDLTSYDVYMAWDEPQEPSFKVPLGRTITFQEGNIVFA